MEQRESREYDMWRPCGTFDNSYAKDLAIIRTPVQWGLMIVSLVVVFLIPYCVGGQALNTINLIAITVIAVQGVNILTGMTGQITLGQTALMAVGAYSMTLVGKYWGLSFWLSVPTAMLITGLVGLIFGIPSLRIKGFYLAMSTLAAQFIIPWIIFNVRPDVTGGKDTVPVPAPCIGNFIFNTQDRMFYLCMSVAIFVTYFTRNIQRSRIGRAFIAIRDNDLAAEIMGIEVFRYKLLSFFICALYAGLAGCLYASWMRGVSVDHFELSESVWYLGMLIIGGMGNVAGAWFGVIFIRSLDVLVRYVGVYMKDLFPAKAGAAILLGIGPVVFGVIGILFLIFEPKGISRMWERFKAFYRIWPFSY